MSHFKGPFTQLTAYAIESPHPLASAWAKYNRAIEHHRELTALVHQLFSATTESGTLRAVPVRHGEIEIRALLPPVPLSVSCLVGDVVHCLRSALDHAAWALALRANWKGKAREIAFPLFGSAERFEGARLRIVDQFGEDAAIVLSRVQPFNDRAGLLWLQDLDNADKHEALVVTRHRLLVYDVRVIDARGERSIMVSGGDLQAPAPIDVAPEGVLLGMRYEHNDLGGLRIHAEIQNSLALRAVENRSWPADRVDLVLREAFHLTEDALIDVMKLFPVAEGERLSKANGWSL